MIKRIALLCLLYVIAMQPENYGASSHIMNEYYWLRAAGYNGSMYYYLALGETNSETVAQSASDRVSGTYDLAVTCKATKGATLARSPFLCMTMFVVPKQS